MSWFDGLIGYGIFLAGDLGFLFQKRTTLFAIVEILSWLGSLLWWCIRWTNIGLGSLESWIGFQESIVLSEFLVWGLAFIVVCKTVGIAHINHRYTCIVKSVLVASSWLLSTDHILWCGFLLLFLSWTAWLLSFASETPAQSPLIGLNFIGDLCIFLGLVAFTQLQNVSTITDVLAHRMELLLPEKELWHFISGGLLLFGCIIKMWIFPRSPFTALNHSQPFWIQAVIMNLVSVTTAQMLLLRFAPYWTMFPIYKILLVGIGGGGFLLCSFQARKSWDLYTIIDRLLTATACFFIIVLPWNVGFLSQSIILAHLWIRFFILYMGNLIVSTLSFEHDVRAMGGLKQRIPQTSLLCLGGILLSLLFWIHIGLHLTSMMPSMTCLPLLVVAYWIAFTIHSNQVVRVIDIVFARNPRFDERVMAYVHESSPLLRSILATALVGIAASLWFFSPWNFIFQLSTFQFGVFVGCLFVWLFCLYLWKRILQKPDPCVEIAPRLRFPILKVRKFFNFLKYKTFIKLRTLSPKRDDQPQPRLNLASMHLMTILRKWGTGDFNEVLSLLGLIIFGLFIISMNGLYHVFP